MRKRPFENSVKNLSLIGVKKENLFKQYEGL